MEADSYPLPGEFPHHQATKSCSLLLPAFDDTNLTFLPTQHPSSNMSSTIPSLIRALRAALRLPRGPRRWLSSGITGNTIPTSLSLPCSTRAHTGTAMSPQRSRSLSCLEARSSHGSGVLEKGRIQPLKSRNHPAFLLTANHILQPKHVPKVTYFSLLEASF